MCRSWRFRVSKSCQEPGFFMIRAVLCCLAKALHSGVLLAIDAGLCSAATPRVQAQVLHQHLRAQHVVCGPLLIGFSLVMLTYAQPCTMKSRRRSLLAIIFCGSACTTLCCSAAAMSATLGHLPTPGKHCCCSIAQHSTVGFVLLWVPPSVAPVACSSACASADAAKLW